MDRVDTGRTLVGATRRADAAGQTRARTYVRMYERTCARPRMLRGRRSGGTEESVDLRRGRAHVPRPGHTRVLRSQGNMLERDQTRHVEAALDGRSSVERKWAVHTPSLSTASAVAARRVACPCEMYLNFTRLSSEDIENTFDGS